MKLEKNTNPKVKLNFINSPLFYKILIGAICFIITIFIVITGAAPVKYDLKVDDVCPEDILAPRDVEDKGTTEKLRQNAEMEIGPVYDFDNEVINFCLKEVYNFFSNVQTVRLNKDLNIDAKVKELKKMSDIKLTDEKLAACIKVSQSELSQLQIAVPDTLRQVMDKGVEEDALDTSINYAKQLIQKVDMSQELRDLSYNILAGVIKPNKIVNMDKTKQAKENARASVKTKWYKKGEIIVRKSERVKHEHIEILNELGLVKGNQNNEYPYCIGTALIVFLLFMIGILYFYYFERKIFNDNKRLILLSLIFILALVITTALKNLSSMYLIPVSFAAMLIAILLNANIAIVVNFILSILVALITRGDINFICFTFISGTFAAYIVAKPTQRSKLVLSGMLVCIVNVLLIISFGMFEKNTIGTDMFLKSLNGVVNGAFSVVITVGTLPFWETAFNIITPIKLLELSNPNQPLLKKLLIEAPGTYHHSLMVGNLAEVATEAVGGDALLARVAAYYHDIGKLKRPYFFKENQYNDNPHDRMTANLSTLVITSHTKDGAEIAKQYKLPKVIIDILKQHHGTTLVQYFYHKAVNVEKEDVKAEDFRYEGPKPQSKEAAVVMLADCVEAAVRAMPDRTEGKIEGMVRKIIKSKLDDGQLDMCNLTLKDLDKIARAFLRVLCGFFHERIEYPEQINKSEIDTKKE